jgi:hypothetical protein
MNKGVVDQRASSSGATAGGAVRVSSEAVQAPLNPEGAGSSQRRRRRQRRHDVPERHPGNGKQFAVVTLVAIAILFLILYALLPREEKTTHEEPQSSVAPGSTLPCPRAGPPRLSRLVVL